MSRIKFNKISIMFSLFVAGSLVNAVPVEVRPLSSGSITKSNSENGTVYAQLAQFQEELKYLKQKNEEQEQQIAALKEEMDKKNSTPLKKLSTIFGTEKTSSDVDETQLSEDNASPTISSASQPQTANTSLAVSDDDKKAYIQAYETFRATGAEKAIVPMRDFIQHYPKSPYMPNAHYWLGEFYLASNPPQFAKARQEFNLVYKLYPKTTKASAATYRLATMAEVEDNSKLATSLMQFILDNYPKSQEAGFARNYLVQNGKLKSSGLSSDKISTFSAKSATNLHDKMPAAQQTKTFPTKSAAGFNAAQTLTTQQVTRPATVNNKPSSSTSTLNKKQLSTDEKENKSKIVNHPVTSSTNTPF